MKQPLVVIYSVLVFLIALFFFNFVFYALGAVLVFLVVSTLVEIIWQYRKSEKLWRFLRPIINFSLSGVFAICFYCLFFLPLDFLLTEILMVTPKLPKMVNFGVLVLFIVFFVFYGWQRLLKKKNSYLFLLFFIFASGFFYLGYRKQKLALEYLPKIYSLEGKWGIQGMTVVIKGVNFGPTWKSGSVLAGETLFNNLEWSENKIKAELTVPADFGNFQLTVIRFDKILSNGFDYEVRDPKTLEIKK
jgi:hypothetical protein